MNAGHMTGDKRICDPISIEWKYRTDESETSLPWSSLVVSYRYVVKYSLPAATPTTAA